MKKEIVQYATGKFKHFDGKEREFTVCMVSISPEDYPCKEYYCREDDEFLFDNESNIHTKANSKGVLTAWQRYVNFGVSVRNPNDSYNEDIAKKIAYGKANSTKGYTVAFDDLALMSTDVATALLKNFVERVSNDPSLAIQNYEEQEALYNTKKAKKAMLSANDAISK
jgi:hypothetical protein